MATTDELLFEMQRRVILFNSGTTMPDNINVLGYEGNPNLANTSTSGQTLLYNSPRGTHYIELVNGNLWYKQQIPNTWINLTSGTASGTANFSSQNNVVYTTGNQDISGVKNFYSRPTVNGSGVLLIGETGSVALPNTLVYTTGDQSINGLKDFTTRPTVNTIPVLLSGEVNTTISGVLYSAQINIKNNNGSTIYKGQPVYVSSAAGTNILVKLASNSGEQTSSKTLGLVYQTSLAQNAQGTIVTEGLLQGFNTNAGEEGDPIWLGPTGSLIFGLANKPYAPNHLVYLGVLTRKHANQGEVFVKIQNGFELEELHNVNINHTNALADKNIIRYDSLSGIWFNDIINSVLPNSIVYNTGNQIISGNKTFDVLPVVSGNKLITGLDLSSYATVSNLFSTGSILDNKINSLSGYVNSQTSSGQVFSTGSILDNKINSLSGYVNSQDILFSGQTFNTGSRLDNKINALSGYVTGISLGGLLPSTIVYITGNQTISGTKTFANNLEVQGTGIFNALDLSNISEFNFSGTNINLINGNVNISGGTLYISGNAVLTGVNLNAYATTANLYATGSTLDNKINSLSGYVNAQSTSGQVFNTGSNLDNKINSLSGYVNSQDAIFSGQTFNTGSRLDNKINSLSGYVDSKDITFSGQIASTGSSLYNSILSLSGLFTGYTGNLDANFATDAQLFTTGSVLDNKINSLSGYVNSQSTSGQVFNTGSILNNKINSLSGYVNSQDSIFSGQTFNTGSRLDSKINSLSGYVDSKSITLPSTIVYTTGDQLISGNKTFLNNLQVSGTSIFQDINIINLNELVISGAKIIIGGDSGVYSYTNIYISGNPVLTGVLPTIQSISNVVYTTGNQTISGNKNFAENVVVGDQAQNDILIIFDNKITFGVYPTVNGTGIVYTQGDQTISGIKTFASRPTVNGTGVLLIGEASAITLPTTIVYTTGDQLISGNKIFLNNIAVSGTGNFNNVRVSSIDKLFLSGIDILITGNSSINVYNAIYISGNPVLTGIIPSSQTLANVVYTTGNQNINGTKNFLDNIAVSGTGNFNNVKVSSIDKLFLSGIDMVITGNSSINVYNAIYISGNPVLTGVIPSSQIITDVVYTTGNQIISGVKTFASRPTVNGTGVLLSGEAAGLPNTLVYTTGNQLISGTKTFDSPIVFSSGTNDGIYLGGSGGSINLRGGDGDPGEMVNGSKGGNITMVGSTSNNAPNGAGNINTSAIGESEGGDILTYGGGQEGAHGGSITTIGGSVIFSTGGSINTSGGDNPGGSIDTSGGSDGAGGSINTSGGGDGSGGSIDLSNGGGSINTAGGDNPGGSINTSNGGGSIDLSENGGANFSIQTGNLPTQNDGSIYNKINDRLYIRKSGVWEEVITNQGDQTINGLKTFVNNIIISGTGIFDAIDLNNIDTLNLSGVDISITNGNVSLTNRPTVNGSGVVLSGELNPIIVNTGSILDNKINSLSGYVNSQDIIFSGQTANTGSRLDNKINALSGYVNSQTASGQIFNTGSVLDSKINSLSGYVNSQGIIIIGQIASTGSILNNKINSLSGYVNSQDNIFSGQTFNTGSRLDNKINSLSGYINAQNIVFSGQTFNTGSRLNNKIDSLSGYINSPASNIVYTIGDQIISGDKNFVENVIVGDQAQDDILIIFDNKITFGVYPTINGTGIVYTEGDQTISGIKTFASRPNVNGTGVLLIGEASSSTLPNTIVYNTGDQIISGVKSFTNNLVFQDNLLQSSQASGYLTGIGYTGNYDGGYFLGKTKLSQNTSRLVDSSFGNTWVAKDSSRNWQSISISSDGKYQSATVYNGKIYVSSDYGNSWVAKESTRNWYGISISSDGKYQSATVADGGQIYVSSDYGNSWAPKESSRNWYAISISSDGKYQSATVIDGQIYVSSDYGNSWVAKESNRGWRSISISSDGKYQSAVVYGGQIYVSSDYGNTWVTKESARQWFSISISSDGKYQSAVVYGGQIYVSSNYGNTWVAKESNRNWYAISISSDGKYQSAVAAIGQIYISSDYGNSWLAKENNRLWRNISISSDGKYISAVGTAGGQIYTSKTDEQIDGNLYVDNLYANNLVYNTGNQAISGVKTFDLLPIVSGNRLITGVDLSSYATNANLFTTGSILDNKINSLSGYISGISAGGTLPSSIVYITGNQTISGVKTFANTGSFDTIQITNKKLSSYNYVSSNFIFGDIYINIANSSNNIIGTLPNSITSGINYYVKNLNTGILLITGSGQRTIDGFSNINLYKNESLQLLGVNNVGYTGWVTLSADNGVS